MSRQDITLQPQVMAAGALRREAAAWPARACAAGLGSRADAAAAVPDPMPRAAPAQTLTHAVVPRTCCAEVSCLSPVPLQAGH